MGAAQSALVALLATGAGVVYSNIQSLDPIADSRSKSTPIPDSERLPDASIERAWSRYKMKETSNNSSSSSSKRSEGYGEGEGDGESIPIQKLHRVLLELNVPNSSKYITSLFDRSGRGRGRGRRRGQSQEQGEGEGVVEGDNLRIEGEGLGLNKEEFFLFVREREQELYNVYVIIRQGDHQAGEEEGTGTGSGSGTGTGVSIGGRAGGEATGGQGPPVMSLEMLAGFLEKNEIARSREKAQALSREFLGRLDVRQKQETDRRKNEKYGTPFSYRDLCGLMLLVPEVDMKKLFDHWEKSSKIDIGENYTLPDDSPVMVEKSALNNFISGFIAGCVSRTATAPLDRLKTIMQAGKGDRNISHMMRYMYKEGGWIGFWRGNGVNCLKIGPESATKFMLYGEFKQMVATYTNGNVDALQPGEKFLAGAGAGACAQLLVYPLEMIKTRLALSTTGEYKSALDVVRQLVARGGALRIYRGLTPSLLGIIPYAGIDLMIYNTLKENWVRNHGGTDRTPGVMTMLSYGAFSSSCGQLVAFPLQVIRTKLQADKASPSAYGGMLDCFQQTLKRDGWRGLYRGLGPNFLKTVPAISISYAVYETSAVWVRGYGI
jgi:solute carrier family 25 (mitochondrial phosphate transporter), member 23/24/25/41